MWKKRRKWKKGRNMKKFETREKTKKIKKEQSEHDNDLKKKEQQEKQETKTKDKQENDEKYNQKHVKQWRKERRERKTRNTWENWKVERVKNEKTEKKNKENAKRKHQEKTWKQSENIWKEMKFKMKTEQRKKNGNWTCVVLWDKWTASKQGCVHGRDRHQLSVYCGWSESVVKSVRLVGSAVVLEEIVFRQCCLNTPPSSWLGQSRSLFRKIPNRLLTPAALQRFPLQTVFQRSRT